MTFADLSIRRPIFITSVVILMIAVGLFSLKNMPIDVFPDITIPVVTVNTIYPGASPSEIETIITKPVEDEMSTLAGVKRLTSISQEGYSVVVLEFTLETDVKYAEQQVRDRIGAVKKLLPTDIREPVVRRIDFNDQAIVMLSLSADLPLSEIYELADKTIRSRFEQINQVGMVEIYGGRKREIQVQLDRNLIKQHELSATTISQRLSATGENVPAGKVDDNNKELVFRSLGQFRNLKDIENSIVSFFGSEVPTTVKDVGRVVDTLADETSRFYFNGQKAVSLYVYKQSGANTIKVVDNIKKRVDEVNKDLAKLKGQPQMTVVRDGSIYIKNNVKDVQESIILGIILAIFVVYLFLANGRSTIITGVALPNSLIGAFILMSMAGFSVNIMSLLALSLSVGLLVDDAIVVRENIFRHIERGKPPLRAAIEGTLEVRMAVIATTLAVLAVFGPVGFLKGVTGQFFKQFGLTVCFAMAISLFDALTMAPMLSAYFAGAKVERKRNFWNLTVGRFLEAFSRFQDWLEKIYVHVLKFTVHHPLTVLLFSVVVTVLCVIPLKYIPKTFQPPQEGGEFSVNLDLPPGATLSEMDKVTQAVEQIVRKNSEVELTATVVGGKNEESNKSSLYVKLIPQQKRKATTSQMKERVRSQITDFAYANPKVKDFDFIGGGQRGFMLNIMGNDQKQLEEYAQRLFERIKKIPGLTDPDTSFRTGKQEFQVSMDTHKADKLGVSSLSSGLELRALIEGTTPAKYRENDKEYDVRVRLKEGQRNIRDSYKNTYIPNINQQLVKLADVSTAVETEGISSIMRLNRSRYIQISADLAPGAGLTDIVAQITRMFDNEYKLPPGMNFAFVGQAESFQELGDNLVLVLLLGVIFIFLVLSSLYESFVTPISILLALPLAMVGAFVALWVTGQSLNIFSIIGGIMLLGIASKNAILLVDFAKQKIDQGMERGEAMIAAGKSRLRPILMTTMALIMGTLPVALGLNEASRQRVSMGIAIIGGLISSTLLTLVVVPAAFIYIDRFRLWSKKILKRLFAPKTANLPD